MVDIPSHDYEAENRPQSGGIFGIAKKLLQAAQRLFTGELTKGETIHPDFRMYQYVDAELTWHQNESWGIVPNPPFKLGFYFNDPAVLDHCPWVCKFGKNLNKKIPGFKYFCVAYGRPELHRKGFGLEEMKEWAMQFDHPSLMHYNGKLIKMLKEEDRQA